MLLFIPLPNCKKVYPAINGYTKILAISGIIPLSTAFNINTSEITNIIVLAFDINFFPSILCKQLIIIKISITQQIL